jgi:hypothetical protein
MEFSIKSGQHGIIGMLNLVQNWVRFNQKKPAEKKYISLQQRAGGKGFKLRNALLFLCQTEFHPVLIPSFPFSLSASIAG